MDQVLVYLFFIAAGMCLFVFIMLCSYYYVEPLHSSSSTLIRISSILAITLYCINCGLLGYRLSFMNADQQPTTIREWIVVYTSFGIWRIAQSLTYIIFIQRLKTTFKNTKYASTSCTYNILYFVAVLFIIPEIAKDVSHFVNNHFTLKTADITIIIESIISSMIDLVLSITLLYLFLKKLYSLNLDIARLSDGDHKLRLKYKQINNIIAKISILSIWSLTSTQLLMIAVCIEFFMHNIEANTMHIISFIWMIIWALDCCINSFCLFLSFDFALGWYLCACTKCHKDCVKCCSTITGDNKYNNNNHQNIEYKREQTIARCPIKPDSTAINDSSTTTLLMNHNVHGSFI